MATLLIYPPLMNAPDTVTHQDIDRANRLNAIDMLRNAVDRADRIIDQMDANLSN